MKIKLVIILTFIASALLFNGCSKNEKSSFTLPDLDYAHLLPYQENNLYGVMDSKTGKWVIPAQYKKLQFIDDKRLALVEVKGKYAVISMDNQVLVDFDRTFWDVKKIDTSVFAALEISFAELVPDNSYIFRIENKTVNIQKIPNLSISGVITNDKDVFYIGNDIKGKKAVIYHPSSEKVVNDTYSELSKLSNHLLYGVQDSKSYLVDYKGGKIMEVDGTPSVAEGDSLIEVRSSRENGFYKGLVDLKGKIIVEPVYSYIYKISDSIYRCEDNASSKFMFNSRNSEISPVIDVFYNRNRSYLIVKTEEKDVAINTGDGIAIDFSEYQNIEPVLGQEFDVNKPTLYRSSDEYENKKYGVFRVFNNKVQKLTEPLYDLLSEYSGGYALAGNKVGESDYDYVFEYFILDEKGMILTKLGKKDWSYPAFETFAGHFFINDGDKQYLLDKGGKDVWKNKYDKVKIEYAHNLLYAFKGNQLELFSKELKKIASLEIKDLPEYDFSIQVDSLSGAVIAYGSGSTFFINIKDQKLSEPFQIDKLFKSIHIVYFYKEEDTEHENSIYTIVDNDGNQLLNPVYETISYEKELGLILAWKHKGLEVYDTELNLLLDDVKIENYTIDKELKLLYLSNEAETYSFYLGDKGKKLVK